MENKSQLGGDRLPVGRSNLPGILVENNFWAVRNPSREKGRSQNSRPPIPRISVTKLATPSRKKARSQNSQPRPEKRVGHKTRDPFPKKVTVVSGRFHFSKDLDMRTRRAPFSQFVRPSEEKVPRTRVTQLGAVSRLAVKFGKARRARRRWFVFSEDVFAGCEAELADFHVLLPLSPVALVPYRSRCRHLLLHGDIRQPSAAWLPAVALPALHALLVLTRDACALGALGAYTHG